MKMKTLELLRNFQHRLSRSRRWLFVAVITLCLIPSNTRAQGIGDILLLLHTITSTLQGPIGDALNEMRKVSTEINNFRQKIIWPLALINQTRSFVSATRAHYTGLMSQIEGIKNNSATLALPMQLESMFRGAQSGSIGQIPSLYTQVYQPVALAGIAQPGQRNLMDIDDAMAMDSLKTSIVSDQIMAQQGSSPSWLRALLGSSATTMARPHTATTAFRTNFQRRESIRRFIFELLMDELGSG